MVDILRTRLFRLIPVIFLFVANVMATSGQSVSVQKMPLSGDGNIIRMIRNHFKTGPLYDWRLVSEEKGLDGSVISRFRQIFRGYNVEGAVVIVHSDKGKNSITGHFAELNLPDEPVLKKTGNEVLHLSDLATDLPKDDFQMNWVWKQVESEYQMVLKVDYYSERQFAHQTVFLDPETSGIIEKIEHKCHFNHAGTAQTTYHGTCQITTQFHQSQYQLRSSDRGNGIVTLNLNHKLHYQSVSEITDSDNLWDQYNVPLATDAHFCAEKYYDFLQSHFQRNSLDNNGYPLKSYVNYGQSLANAFWNGGAVVYGSGNSITGALTVIDIAGHEFTHGLIQKTAALNYANEPGIINEAVADIFGVALDHFAFPAGQNWTVAERTGQPVRSFSDPLLYGQPKEFMGQGWYNGTGDNGGVHINSGFINYWYYLLSEGGTGINSQGWSYQTGGVGREKSLNIVYQSLIAYLVPQSGFEDFYHATINAAIDLYGNCSAEHLAVIESWKAVGYQNQAMVSPAIHSTGSSFCQGQTLNMNATGMPGSLIEWYRDGISMNLFGRAITIDAPGVYQVSENRCGAIHQSSPLSISMSPTPQAAASSLFGCPDDALELEGYPAGGIFSIPNPYSGPATSFTYTFTDTSGCTASAQAFIYRYITHLPEIRAQKEQVPVNGRPVQLFSDSGIVFIGTGVTGNFFDPSVAGIGGPYQIVTNYVDHHGCHLENSTSITVLPPCRTISELPVIEGHWSPVEPDYIHIRAIGTEGFDINWEIEGVWHYTGNTDNGQILLFSPAEQIDVRLWFSNSCGDSSAIIKTFIKQHPKVLSVYPNPVSGSFAVEGKEISSVRLYDSQGKVLIDELFPIGKQKISISTEDLAVGIYGLVVKDGAVVYRRKVAKE